MLIYKLISAVLIFIIALSFGLWPIKTTQGKLTKRLLNYGESFARGIFLGTGLIHLLPDAQKHFTQAAQSDSYPYIFTLCTCTILLLFILEQSLVRIFLKDRHDRFFLVPILLALFLSIHSLIAGVALGVEATLAEFMIIAIAIIAHKGAASFALAINLKQHDFCHYHMVQLIIIFTLMTPLGILAGTGLASFLSSNPGHIIEGVFNAIAAGTFIYIATLNNINLSERPSWRQASFFALGIATMALLAIWV